MKPEGWGPILGVVNEEEFGLGAAVVGLLWGAGPPPRESLANQAWRRRGKMKRGDPLRDKRSMVCFHIALLPLQPLRLLPIQPAEI